jgi:hypothetical protein
VAANFAIDPARHTNLPPAQRFLNADLPALAAALEFDANSIPYVDFERIVVG